MVANAEVIPRDLDLVIPNATTEELASAFDSFLVRRTRFGGFNLRFDRLPVDIWPLEATWAFNEGLFSPTQSMLPSTTFLNVEAVAADLLSSPGHPRAIYENGFFDGILNRVLDINLEANPFPELCVVRSIVCAQKTGFAMSRRLAEYVCFHAPKLNDAALVDVQVKHYGHVKCSSSDFRRFVQWLDDGIAKGAASVSVAPVQAEFLTV